MHPPRLLWGLLEKLATCGSAQQTARMTFTTLTKAFMARIIKAAMIKQENLSGCKRGNILSTRRLSKAFSYITAPLQIPSSRRRDLSIRRDFWFVSAFPCWDPAEATSSTELPSFFHFEFEAKKTPQKPTFPNFALPSNAQRWRCSGLLINK